VRFAGSCSAQYQTNTPPSILRLLRCFVLPQVAHGARRVALDARAARASPARSRASSAQQAQRGAWVVITTVPARPGRA